MLSKDNSIVKVIITGVVLVCCLGSQGHAGLAFRTTFNDASHVPVSGTYESQGTLGVGSYIWLTTGVGDLATVAGQGPIGNNAVQLSENNDFLAVRRWVAPIDQFADADLSQVASGMSFGYWLMADETSGSPMSLLITRSGDLPTGNTNITHGLRHNGQSAPYTSRRMAIEEWGTASAATEFTANQWHHLVFTYSSGAAGSVQKSMYIDGSNVYTSAADQSIVLATSGAHRIGGLWNGSTYTEHFEGKIDQFDVWDHDLSDAEVLAAYNEGPVTPPDPNVGIPWLRFTFNDIVGDGLVVNDGSSDYYGQLIGDSSLYSIVDSAPGSSALELTDSPSGFAGVAIKNDSTDILPATLAVPNGLSVAYWVRFDVYSSSYGTLLATGSNGTNMPDSIQHSFTYPDPDPGGPYTQRRLYDYGWWSSGSAVYDPNTWYHVVYTYEPIAGEEPNSILRVYVDGLFIDSVARGPLKLDDTRSATLGILYNQGYKEAFDGQIDQFEIYDLTLNSAQVGNLYSQGPETAREAQLFVRFTFNEHAPGVNPGSSNVANTGVPGSTYYGKTYRDGTELTSTTYVSSPGNTAMHFEDGNKDFVALLNTGSPSDRLPTTLIDDGMSVVYWVRFDVSNDAYVSLLTTGTNGPGQLSTLVHSLRYTADNSVGPFPERWFLQNGIPPAGQTAVQTGQWYQLVWTIKGPDFGDLWQRFYVNGQLRHAWFESPVIIGAAVATRFGVLNRSGYKEPFAGDLDQLDIYDYTLTPAEITALYAGGPVHTAPTNCTEVIERGYGLSYDHNGNCFTDMPDFADFVQEWLKCVEPDYPDCDQVLFN